MAQPEEAKVVIHQEGITPFWQKLPAFLAYPLHMSPMMTIGMLSAASVVCAFAGGLFRGLIAYLFLRFAFSVMEQAARGDSDPDSPDLSMWGGKDHRPAKQAIVFLFYFAILVGIAMLSGVSQSRVQSAAAPRVSHAQSAPATAPAERIATQDDDDDDAPATTRRSAVSTVEADASEVLDAPGANEPDLKLPWWFYALAIVCAIPLPGAVMVIALEDSLVRALNPMTTLFFIRGMGGAYFILWFCFAVIFGLREGVVMMLANASPFIRLPAETFLGSYLMLALFATMGYALYQYHQELGYDVNVDFDSKRKKEVKAADTTKDPLLRNVNALVTDGKTDEALRLVLDAMRYDKLNVDLNDKAAEIYAARGETAKALAHRQAQLKGLVAAKNGAKALVLLKKLKDMDPAFAPDAESRLPLAEAAYAARDPNKAIELLKGFDKLFPGHADIAGIYFLGARITSEHLRNDEKAMNILKAVVQRYPQSPVAKDAAQYLAVLEKVKATKPAAAPAAK